MKHKARRRGPDVTPNHIPKHELVAALVRSTAFAVQQQLPAAALQPVNTGTPRATQPAAQQTDVNGAAVLAAAQQHWQALVLERLHAAQMFLPDVPLAAMPRTAQELEYLRTQGLLCTSQDQHRCRTHVVKAFLLASTPRLMQRCMPGISTSECQLAFPCLCNPAHAVPCCQPLAPTQALASHQQQVQSLVSLSCLLFGCFLVADQAEAWERIGGSHSPFTGSFQAPSVGKLLYDAEDVLQAVTAVLAVQQPPGQAAVQVHQCFRIGRL